MKGKLHFEYSDSTLTSVLIFSLRVLVCIKQTHYDLTLALRSDCATAAPYTQGGVRICAEQTRWESGRMLRTTQWNALVCWRSNSKRVCVCVYSLLWITEGMVGKQDCGGMERKMKTETWSWVKNSFQGGRRCLEQVWLSMINLPPHQSHWRGVCMCVCVSVCEDHYSQQQSLDTVKNKVLLSLSVQHTTLTFRNIIHIQAEV